MKSSDPTIRLATAEVISLFSLEPKYRKTLRESGCLSTVVENLFIPNEDIQKFSALTISNIAINEQDADIIYNLGGITSLVKLLNSTNVQVVLTSSLAITNLAHSLICRHALIE